MAARISLDPPRSLSYRLGAWYSRRKYGQALEPGLALAHSPRVMRAVARLELAVLKWRALPPGLSHLAVLGAASALNCSWCMDFSYWVGYTDGIDPRQLRAVAAWRDSDAFTPLERRVLELAEAMSQTPPAVTDEMIAALREDLTEAQLVELAMLIAVENQRSRFNLAMGLTSQGFSDSCAVPA